MLLMFNIVLLLFYALYFLFCFVAVTQMCFTDFFSVEQRSYFEESFIFYLYNCFIKVYEVYKLRSVLH